MKKKVGDKVTARDKAGSVLWEPTIRGIARFLTPDGYEPALMLVEHKNGSKEVYFPYWKTAGGKQRFANRPPMFAEDVWLELLRDAIKQDFFSKNFLKGLATAAVDAL